MANTPFNTILEMLGNDMVSRGLVAQCIRESDESQSISAEKECGLLRNLLTSKIIEIGTPRLLNSDYVEFAAWVGPVEDRVCREMEAVAKEIGHDKEFNDMPGPGSAWRQDLNNKKSGETVATARGRAAHIAKEYGPGYKKEFRLPSGEKSMQSTLKRRI
jgi:hypothetical protein